MARIGMVSIWFHRGQSEVTRTLRQAMLDNGHEVFIFSRRGGVYGMEKEEKDDPYWKLPNVYWFPKYEIPTQALVLWVKLNKLDAVVFNEEYDFNLPASIRGLGVKTIHYVDFVREDWAEPLHLTYNQLWSATSRTSFLLQEVGLGDLLTHIGWGVHPSVPYLGEEEPQYDFFHNAGWIGINFRKGTDLVLRAFERLRQERHDATLLVHAQVSREEYLQLDRSGSPVISGLTWRHETVPSPGLYHLGKVVVHPSRLEGLGLPLVEALYQGRKLITTDAPPMNEFVARPDDLVQIASAAPRSDGLSFPECTANVDLLAEAMACALDDWEIHGDENRLRALEIFDWSTFCGRIQDGLAAIGVK